MIGRVVKVADGDTVTIENGERHKVRLFGIDAPEKKQTYGATSKMELTSHVLGRELTLRVCGVDRYRRIVGELILEQESVNARMLKDGHAWHYVAYSRRRDFQSLELKARRGKLGLWKEANPTPPWEFRRHQKKIDKQRHQKRASNDTNTRTQRSKARETRPATPAANKNKSRPRFGVAAWL